MFTMYLMCFCYSMYPQFAGPDRNVSVNKEVSKYIESVYYQGNEITFIYI